MVVVEADGRVRPQLHVVLPLKAGTSPEFEARAPAAEGPVDRARVDVHEVRGPRVAHRNQEASIPGELNRVDVVGVPGKAVGRKRCARVA